MRPSLHGPRMAVLFHPRGTRQVDAPQQQTKDPAMPSRDTGARDFLSSRDKYSRAARTELQVRVVAKGLGATAEEALTV